MYLQDIGATVLSNFPAALMVLGEIASVHALCNKIIVYYIIRLLSFTALFFFNLSYNCMIR